MKSLLLFFGMLCFSFAVLGKEQYTYKGVTVINLTDCSTQALMENQIDLLDIKGSNIMILIKTHGTNVSSLVTKDNYAISYEYKREIVQTNRSFVISLQMENMIAKRVNVDRILKHEMKHIEQFFLGNLRTVDDHTVEYKNKLINIKKVKYLERTYELEAIEWETKQ